MSKWFSTQKGAEGSKIVREATRALDRLLNMILGLASRIGLLEAAGALGALRWIDASRHGVVPALPDAGPAITAMLAATAAGAYGLRRDVYIPAGDYTIATAVVHPANVRVRGAGIYTRFLQPAGATNVVWDFANGFLRSELAHCQVLGGTVDPNDFTDRAGIGVDLAETQQVVLHRMQIWDFETGLRLSNGTPFSSYHDVGPHVEVNRCTTGIYAPNETNNTTIRQCRVFYSYGAAGEGVGIDVVDAGGLTIEECAIEAADTCLRVRAADGGLHLDCRANYYEPGTNPTTTEVGQAYDVVVVNAFDGDETFHDRASVVSALRGNIQLPPEGFCSIDGYSQAFFGARFNGAAVPKRNLIRNGALDQWALPDVLPNWAGGGVLPTLTENTADFITGARSMDVTATATGSSVAALFTVSDPGVEWVTCGVRYRVASGNVGFFFAGSAGGNTRQLADYEDADEWRVRWVQVPIGAANREGSVSIVPDSVDGVGTVTIDEVWAVAGRFAIPSTQFAERVLLLPAPIEIAADVITSNDTWGPIDITALTGFGVAPLGVVGAIIRLRIAADDGVGTSALTFPFYIYADIPGIGASTIAADIQRVTPIFSTLPAEATVIVRSTSLSGAIILGTGYDTTYSVDLIGWVLQ